MANCAFCGENAAPPFECSYCGNYHCPEHRLPESHECVFVTNARSLGPEFRDVAADPDDDSKTSEQVDKTTQFHERKGTSSTDRTSSNPRDLRPPSGRTLKDASKPAAMDNVPTVGNTKQPPTSPSPPTELKDRSKIKASSNRGQTATKTGRAVALIGMLVMASFLISGAIAGGVVSAGDFLGAPGDAIDDQLRQAAAANETGANSTPTSAPERTDKPTTKAAAAAGEQTPTPTLTATATPTPTPEPAAGDLDREHVEELVHEEINERRREHGLSELDHDPALREIAQDYSQMMASENELSHHLDEGSVGDRYERFGYECRVRVSDDMYMRGAENILYTYYRERLAVESGDDYYETPEELAAGIVDTWMNSSGHRDNILKPYWENQGIGIVVEETENGYTRVWVTQNFC